MLNVLAILVLQSMIWASGFVVLETFYSIHFFLSFFLSFLMYGIGLFGDVSAGILLHVHFVLVLFCHLLHSLQSVLVNFSLQRLPSFITFINTI